jgi:carbon-monoxide dehydrogenase medium subunit
VKPAPFEYVAPTTVEEAIGALAANEDAKVLAGGQSLIPMLALRLTRFDTLVDLGRLPELRGIRIDGANGSGRDVRIGAMTRQRDVAADEAVAAAVPLLARATPLIGHFQIRNRGTLGGSIAHADPAAEYPAVALALGATIDLAGAAGRRSVPASEFFLGTWMTCLEPDEIVSAVRFPSWPGRCGFAVEEVARRHGDFAIAGTACGVAIEGDRVARAAVALFGVASTPVRAPAAEAALVGASVDDVTASLAEIGQLAGRDVDPPADIHASSAYRRHLVGAVVVRAMGRALAEAQGT